MLDQPYMTDLIEANSMGHEPDLIDIYSASWGPTDDGKTVDGPRNATMRAIVRGVNEVSFFSHAVQLFWIFFQRTVDTCTKFILKKNMQGYKIILSRKTALWVDLKKIRT